LERYVEPVLAKSPKLSGCGRVARRVLVEEPSQGEACRGDEKVPEGPADDVLGCEAEESLDRGVGIPNDLSFVHEEEDSEGQLEQEMRLVVEDMGARGSAEEPCDEEGPQSAVPQLHRRSEGGAAIRPCGDPPPIPTAANHPEDDLIDRDPRPSPFARRSTLIGAGTPIRVT
jgi:hypothetical protein